MELFFFSVITPLYNCEDFIIEMIKSIEEQNYSHFELIIVDDHSTDDSFEIAAGYLTKTSIQYRLVKRPMNLRKGVASCRNHAIEISKGDWMCFLDSDDLFDCYKLETLNIELQRSEMSSVAIFHDYHTINEEGKLLKLRSFNQESNRFDISAYLAEKNIICTSACAIKRDIFNNDIKFNTQLNGVEDYFLWLRISKIGTWFYINKCLTKYRLRDKSLMRNRELSHYLEQFSNLKDEIESSYFLTPKEKQVIKAKQKKLIIDFYIPTSIKNFGLYRTIISIFNGRVNRLPLLLIVFNLSLRQVIQKIST